MVVDCRCKLLGVELLLLFKVVNIAGSDLSKNSRMFQEVRMLPKMLFLLLYGSFGPLGHL